MASREGAVCRFSTGTKVRARSRTGAGFWASVRFARITSARERKISRTDDFIGSTVVQPTFRAIRRGVHEGLEGVRLNRVNVNKPCILRSGTFTSDRKNLDTISITGESPAG